MAETAVPAVSASPAAAEVSVYAAGSLKQPFTEAAAACEAAHPGLRLRFTFGAAGLLRERLMAGEPADVFASANMEHPRSLHRIGSAGPVLRFARNSMCALVRSGLDATSATLVERMLDPGIRLGTSTPRADPSGDYAWQLFERIEQSGVPGAFDTLRRKALQLTGGPQTPKPTTGRNIYGHLVARGDADLFLTYCTNAALALREEPSLRSVTISDAINVSASYGIVLLQGASEPAAGFVGFLLAPAGQALLARHGFGPR